MTAKRPRDVQVNAWSSDATNRADLPVQTPWAQRKVRGYSSTLAPAPPADLRDWTHPDVGWGLVLRDNDAMPGKDRARADDAPYAIQRLLASRPGSPVLRWRPELGLDFLRRYNADGTSQDLSIPTPRPGTGRGCIPRYLLIYAPPDVIPWAVQYALNLSTFVGRIDLTGEGLDQYVEALISDWRGHIADPCSPLVWNVDLGQGDITWLMARAIGVKLHASFARDRDLSAGALRLTGAKATAAGLVARLSEAAPALVVTTSHGQTGPLSDAGSLKERLGWLVDAEFSALGPPALSGWNAGGAIWYAHACCSAGSDTPSAFAELFPAENPLGTLLADISGAAGACIAPLPRSLLGRSSPVRAFVGHVEPTFDWTLRHPATGEVLTHSLCDALYTELYQADRRTPIGYALRGLYREAGQFMGQLRDALANVNRNIEGARDDALYNRLASADRQTMVILGDPTVSLPRIGGD